MNIQKIQKVKYMSKNLSKHHKFGNGSFYYGCRCANKNKYDNCKESKYFNPTEYANKKGFHVLVDGLFYPLLNELLDEGLDVDISGLFIDEIGLLNITIKGSESFKAKTGQFFEFKLQDK